METNVSHTNLSKDYVKLLSDYNPFQQLHDNLYKAITELSLLPNTTEIDYFIKIIVHFNGYIESTIKSGNVVGSVITSGPSSGYNETGILISIPNKSKNYNYYIISNIKFHHKTFWGSPGNSNFFVNICLFNDSLSVDDMVNVYKSKKLSMVKDSKKVYNDDCRREIELNDINIKVKCGEIYLFYLCGGSFSFGFSEYQEDGLREKYPLLTNCYMYDWTDKQKHHYDITQNVRKAKLFEIEFC